jgi:glycosyltransferase involved in cell wall biosynthesis
MLLSDRKLVSVLTPTWGRHDLLMACIENVRAQTYRPLEHIIVSDGPDPELRALIEGCSEEDRRRLDTKHYPGDVPIRFVELGRNWSTFLPDSRCVAPMAVAQLLARGDYQTWWSDDERMIPEHIELLVTALENEGADYGRCRFYRTTPDQGIDIGIATPVVGQITNCLHRTDLLKRGLFPFFKGQTSDFACIERWMQAGATWAFVPLVTMTHKADS